MVCDKFVSNKKLCRSYFGFYCTQILGMKSGGALGVTPDFEGGIELKHDQNTFASVNA